MYGMLTKSLLQSLAETRRKDAETLLVAGQYSGAYYLSGYAVECALKAIIASRFVQEAIPPKKLVIDTYTHELGTLIGLAGLRAALDNYVGADPDFAARWGFVSKWSEASRYESWDAASAQTMYQSMADPTKGVLQWIKQFW
jgi:hypothetical protein